MKLTEHLLSQNKELFQKATHHHFLNDVGLLKVEPQHLKSWIVQDRYYTGGYIKMMGIMISRLPLYEDQRELGDNDPSYSPEKAQRIIKTLSFALSNVHRESQFFTDILDRQPYAQSEQSLAQKPWTSRYIDFVKKVAYESGYDLGEALIVLWAMEEAFLTAWSFAKSVHAKYHKGYTNPDNVHESTCQELMKNWTLDEFRVFVDDCAALVNELDYSDARRLASFEKVFKDIMDLEVEFWEMAYD
jgi:thiaminase